MGAVHDDPVINDRRLKKREWSTFHKIYECAAPLYLFCLELTGTFLNTIIFYVTD